MQEEINVLLKEAIVSDMALGFEPEIEVSHKWDLFPRYQQSGFSYVGLALAGEFTSLEDSIRYIARHKARIAAEPDKYILVNNVDDIITAKKTDKLALGFWLQGSAPLANDINMIDTYYQLGIRYMLLCYNTRNAIGDGCVEENDAGLSQFGKKVVTEMNRVGMIVDASHAGFRTSMEIMEQSTQPIMFSHSNVNAIKQHVRNLRDEQIIALGKNGGVIGINGLALFLGSEKSSPEKMVDHIQYISDLIGPQHISLGLDLVYFHEVLELFYQKAGLTTYPKGYVGSMDSAQPEILKELIALLLQRNFSQADIIGILGGNFLRVAKQVWK